jgi:transposase
MNFVGIDVAKDSMEVVVHETSKRWNFMNDESGLHKLIAKMKRFSPCLRVLEATVGYENTVATGLQYKGAFP